MEDEDPDLTEMAASIAVPFALAAGILLIHHGVVFGLTFLGQEVTMFTEFAGYVLMIVGVVMLTAGMQHLDLDAGADADDIPVDE